jgi:hypothetical protein
MLCSASPSLAFPPGIYFVQCKAGSTRAVVYDILGSQVLSFDFNCGPFDLAVKFVYEGLVAAPPTQTDFSGTAATDLVSVNEVPSVFSFGGGRFDATVDSLGTSTNWTLTYDHLIGNVTQAHIHFGQEHTNGAVLVFLCSNLGNGPAGTPACPATPATLSGTLHSSDIVAGAQVQGIAPMQFKAFLAAIRRGATYADVHSDIFPGGEIRGQLLFQPHTKEAAGSFDGGELGELDKALEKGRDRGFAPATRAVVVLTAGEHGSQGSLGGSGVGSSGESVAKTAEDLP